MKIHEIHDLSNTKIISLLKYNFSKISDISIIKNYHPDYENDPANLFYILKSTNGRYRSGCYFVLEQDNNYFCSAGWNRYELDSDIALALTRAYVDPSYRSQYLMGKYFLPIIIEQSKNFKNLYITLNEYNKTIYKWLERFHENRSSNLAVKIPEIYKKFKPIGKQNIYYTSQYVLKYFP